MLMKLNTSDAAPIIDISDTSVTDDNKYLIKYFYAAGNSPFFKYYSISEKDANDLKARISNNKSTHRNPLFNYEYESLKTVKNISDGDYNGVIYAALVDSDIYAFICALPDRDKTGILSFMSETLTENYGLERSNTSENIFIESKKALNDIFHTYFDYIINNELKITKEWVNNNYWYFSKIGGILPHSTVHINEDAFEGNEDLTEIVLPDRIKMIERYTFRNCRNLTTVIIPDNVERIRYEAFAGCTSLKNITIPDSVTIIEHGVFYGCEALTTVAMPDNVVCIADNVFDMCPNVTLYLYADDPDIDTPPEPNSNSVLIDIPLKQSVCAYAKERNIKYIKDAI